MSYVGGCWLISVAWDVEGLAHAEGRGRGVDVPEVRLVRAVGPRTVGISRLGCYWVRILVVGLAYGRALHLRVWGRLRWILGEGV